MGTGPGIFGARKISGAGLSAQRAKMNVVARNIANASTTKTDDGEGPYRRKQVSFTAKDFLAQLNRKVKEAAVKLKSTSGSHVTKQRLEPTIRGEDPGSIIVREFEDASPGRRIYDPAHPDADAEGYVEMPNVSVITEMMDMMAASRAYEANVTAIQSAKRMAGKALEI